MKNLEYNWFTIFRLQISIVVFFISQIASAQCETTNFTVAQSNATCFSNASITVTVPSSTNCSGWVASITRPSDGFATQLNIPPAGGNLAFTSLPAGSYNVSLSNGFQTVNYASNPVVLTTSYVNPSFTITTTPPSCGNSASGYSANGTLTTTIAAGTGLGPFVYTLTASNATQTATSSNRTHTFSGVPGGENVSVSITDQAGGSPGCSVTSTQSRLTPANTAPAMAFSDRPFNYERGDCTPAGSVKKSYVNLFVNIRNLSTPITASTILIAGTTYNLSYVGFSAGNYRFKYDPVATGGPRLLDGDAIRVSFSDGCNTITKTGTVSMNDDYLVLTPSTITDPSTCTQSFRILLFGQTDVDAGSGFRDRAAYFSVPNEVKFERRISTSPDVWVNVPSSEITPNPSATTNPMGVLTGVPIPGATGNFTVSQAGLYRITASDNCHSVQRTVNVQPINPFDNVTATQTTSVLERTSSIRIHFNGHPPLTSPIKVKISRVDGQSRITINPTQPATLAGSYTINFPIERTIPYYPVNYYYIQDLPLGQYIVEMSDGCSETTSFKKTVNVTLTNAVSYNALVSVTTGCVGSNSISYNMNPVNTPNTNNTVRLFTDNGSGDVGSLVQTASSGALSGNFTNLVSGKYVIQFSNIKGEASPSGELYSAAMNTMGPWQYRLPIEIASYKDIKVATVTSFCDVGDANSGIILAQVTEGTIGYPITFSLYSIADPTTPLPGQTGQFVSPTDAVAFQNVPAGEYFVRVSTPCYSVDTNVTLSTTGTVPQAQVSNPVVCPGSPATVAVIAASQNLFDVTWHVNGSDGPEVGRGMPKTFNPTVTTKYTAVYKLTADYGCANSPTYTSDVTVRVTPDPILSLAVSDINLCDSTLPSITISNSQTELSYEIVNATGVSYSPPLVANGNGGSLSISIPNTIALTEGQIFKVKVTNGNAGCTSGELTDKPKVLVNQAPVVSSTNLEPITLDGCDDITAPAAVTTVAELEAMGVTISDDYSSDSELRVSSVDSAMTGTLSKVFTRTYTITDSLCALSTTVNQTITLNITTPTRPTISSGTNTTFCKGDSVVLTSSAATGNQWYKDGVLISGATAQTYTASVAGTYTVVTTNEYTCSSTVSAGVTVVVNALPTATINNGITLAFVNCDANTIDLTASEGSSYVWYYSIDNTTPFSVLSATTQTIPATNLGFYKVKVINNTNCEAESQVTQVVAKPTVSATKLETCIGSTITLNADVTSFVSPTYQWKKGGTAISGATTQNWNVTENGEYSVEVTDGRTTGNIGKQTSCAADVKFNPLPVANAGSDFTIGCVTNVGGLTIGENPEAGFDYTWTSPIGTSGLSNSTIANPVANPIVTTTYTVRKTNRTTLCWHEDSITITVDTIKPIANAGADFTKTCIVNPLGKEIGVASLSGVTYSWFPTTGLDNATKANPIANPNSTTTYTLTVTNSVNGCQATDMVIATVDVSTSMANAGEDFTKTCATNISGKLIGAAVVSGTTYSWFPTTGLSDATIANPNANPAATTEYKVTTTKLITGCTTTDTVTVKVLDTPNPVALSTTIANSCPVETVDLVTIQPTITTDITYEWWTGTTTTRETQIATPATYATQGKVYLWAKTASEGCYNSIPSEVSVEINVCCMPSVGILTNSNNEIQYASADISSLQHINYPTPSVLRYVIVNDFDGKIKQINTTKPEFTKLPAGNYTVHALVFGPTVVPTGLVIGNKLTQLSPLCGTSASVSISIQAICSSQVSHSEIVPNAKQYALVDLATNQFIQVNTTGIFTNIFNGMPHQIVGFNFTGNASGIVVGGTLSGVSATNLDTTAGSIIKGCVAVTTQIEGVLYNDKNKNCRQENDSQEGLPRTTIYLKLLNSNLQVINVTSTDADALYYFAFNADLIDGTYSIILDDNADLTDSTPTYPASWKGNTQTFTIVSGQIVEQLSNNPNFVPMCMQSATEKPAPRKTPNLQGNTYHFCFDQVATAISVDADSRAEINWYTSPSGGVASRIAPVPNTKVVGVVLFYVSQTVNGAESERTEIKIEVQPLPDIPSVISGPILIGSETTQQYSIATSPSMLTYKWTLPSDWIGSSVTEQLNVIVGKQGGTIKVNAISAIGCVGPEQQLDVRVVIEDDIEIYNSISPNGDGVNDELIIRNIDFYPNNTLEIYNRWGVLVYQADGYGQKDVLFKGLSDGRTTMNRNEELPEGTYFYTLMYVNSKGIQRQKAGYLYIKQ